ncbi:MAG: alpha/beta hydrolase-fold protein [Luteococcus japonicus]
MTITRRQALGLGAAGTAVGGAGVATGVWTRKLPGRTRVGYWLGLGGDPEPMPTDPAGAVRQATFSSDARPGVLEKWALALPPGVEAEGLPVVIVLHGWGDDHRFCFDELGLHHYQARLVAEGCQPFALVSLDGDHSYWHRRADGVDWARLVSEGLVQELAKLGLDISRLGLIGWSMGGYGALRLAAEELHGKVRAVASMSTAIYPDWEHCPQGDAFDSPADFEANGLVNRLDRLDGLPIHLSCGVNDFYIDMSKRMAEELSPAPQTMWRRGDHSANFWRRSAPVQLRFLADHL